MAAIRRTLRCKANFYFLDVVSVLGAMWGVAIIGVSWVIH